MPGTAVGGQIVWSIRNISNTSLLKCNVMFYRNVSWWNAVCKAIGLAWSIGNISNMFYGRKKLIRGSGLRWGGSKALGEDWFITLEFKKFFLAQFDLKIGQYTEYFRLPVLCMPIQISLTYPNRATYIHIHIWIHPNVTNISNFQLLSPAVSWISPLGSALQYI